MSMGMAVGLIESVPIKNMNSFNTFTTIFPHTELQNTIELMMI